MKIGYPCINRSLGCSTNRTFRLASYSDERLRETVAGNLECLRRLLEFNAKAGFLFFRISSDIVPFASHPVCQWPWREHFHDELEVCGGVIRANNIRISMHPDQFTLINAIDPEIAERSVRELEYHALVLDTLGLGPSAKIQIHVGGVYGDRPASMARFICRYRQLPESIRRRLVIENDDRQYGLSDCLRLHAATGIPVLFDVFHHRLLHAGEETGQALAAAAATWGPEDGLPMCDYSSQKPGARPGTHTESIDCDDFQAFLAGSLPHDFDLMLEIKDKERSAGYALSMAAGDPRLQANAGSRPRPGGTQ